ncbi:AglZ/HisF2 family acetamidino modification protein [Candidatus Methylopumilus planktonicus]|uniref:AglZ/HisF2 family acetamidino modification protein n=1 Tax=Candidatus Methylopumilus planktonicus TaxID=1581557 RepID=UPI003D187C70
MLRPRIIPCLLVHKGGLVKTIGFNKSRYIGDPINAVRIFNEKEVDELILLDIDATVNCSEPDYRMISNIAAECRMPLCYGGGIKTPEQAKKIISLGVEKIAISSAAIEHPDLITMISNEIGNQSVAIALDVKRKLIGNDYELLTHNGKKKTNLNLFNFIEKNAKIGFGEIIINSIDRDGKMDGFDLFLARKLKNTFNTPITIIGGAGSLQDIENLILKCGIIGASAGSLFVFKGALKAVLINYPSVSQRTEIFEKIKFNS